MKRFFESKQYFFFEDQIKTKMTMFGQLMKVASTLNSIFNELGTKGNILVRQQESNQRPSTQRSEFQ